MISAAASGALGTGAGHTAQPDAPGFWGQGQRISRPDLSTLPRLRFLTTVDFFPFNYLDATGLLAGFHIDLARQICAELELTDRCQIQALPWSELDRAMDEGQGEAIMAGLAVSPESRDRYLFSRPYMRFPARFVTRLSARLAEPLSESVAGKRVGVLGGTAHETLLRDLFPEADVVTYSRSDWLYEDLKSGRIDALLGDGMRLSFWLTGNDAASCCVFAGGPYLAPAYLGQGLAIAVPRDQAALIEAVDFALQKIEASGAFAELYQRYFPVGFY
ncbi:transporter substrate-binding domain-containing protein [Nitratireductor sp. ZSWI3]|uniref:transporter substrate-binding domain-containing protein n=1 Tax=Nitratireductor sp. ZSWI3 TaxID=2966359 RepID=UPI00214FAD5C|nr:transporter substrate-binding domain-containing protein [Nitratireductor sp. ZSWI3]MCR4268963.1 transporter substrate-binding domain-containing protein [Nitratireductor sp. ZSWI3]